MSEVLFQLSSIHALVLCIKFSSIHYCFIFSIFIILWVIRVYVSFDFTPFSVLFFHILSHFSKQIILMSANAYIFNFFVFDFAIFFKLSLLLNVLVYHRAWGSIKERLFCVFVKLFILMGIMSLRLNRFCRRVNAQRTAENKKKSLF